MFLSSLDLEFFPDFASPPGLAAEVPLLDLSYIWVNSSYTSLISLGMIVRHSVFLIGHFVLSRMRNEKVCPPFSFFDCVLNLSESSLLYY